MPTSTFSSPIDAPVDALFDWHARPGAFDRLTPTWESVRVVSRQGGLEAGSRLHLQLALGPLRLNWVAVHTACTPPLGFVDEAESSPFASWRHEHRFEAADHTSRLVDTIEWTVPFGSLGAVFGNWIARQRIERMFAQRHARTQHDLMRHAMTREHGPLTVAITGASGLIGTALTAFLAAGGHTVRRLVRRDVRTDDEIFWSPRDGILDPSDLEGVDAVVHLAGAGIADARWTDERRRILWDSRVDGTALIARTLAAMDDPPEVFVSTSGVGFYGDTGATHVDESAPRGDGFLAELCEAWEAAASPASNAGVRVVHPRFGVVLSARGGALAKMLPAFRLGGGGRLGTGRQAMPWVALDDALGALLHLLYDKTCAGPVNVTAPGLVDNANFTRTLGRVLRRPTIVPVPAVALRMLFGEMADEALLMGQWAEPNRLLDGGFTFAYPDLDSALRFELGRT